MRTDFCAVYCAMRAVLCYGLGKTSQYPLLLLLPLQQFPCFSQIPIYHLQSVQHTIPPSPYTSLLHISAAPPQLIITQESAEPCPSQPPAHSERRSSTPSTQASPLGRTAPLPSLRFLTSSGSRNGTTTWIRASLRISSFPGERARHPRQPLAVEHRGSASDPHREGALLNEFR
jgi:hypothetical protein